jgi:ribosomal protein S18 acetylase RimI-like enzyme
MPAISLYRRFGLAPVGLRPAYYGDDDALIMWAYDIDQEPYSKLLDGMR